MDVWKKGRRALAAAVVVWAAVGANSAEALNRLEFSRPDRFGRMFLLPPFAVATDDMRNALMEVGKPDGILDARDDLTQGPGPLLFNPALSTNNPNNPSHTAGTTFMGQFMDHDMTFDLFSRLGVPAVPMLSPNLRTPAFDLDSVYGDGPNGSPELYDPADRIKFRIEYNGTHPDIPRDPVTMQGIMADPRNDENLMVCGLDVAVLMFHNHMVDLLRSRYPGASDARVFSEARKQTVYHYQWLVLKEFLPLFVGQDMVDDILTHGRHFYQPRYGKAYIPVEFQMAYRFGHSMVRPSYPANRPGDDGGSGFIGMVFDAASEGSPDPGDLRGGARALRRFIDWRGFFNFSDSFAGPNKRIDTHISSPLFHLPLGAIPTADMPVALAQRNLLRHLTWSVPSGQDIAQRMGLPVLGPEHFVDIAQVRQSFATSTPLWFYVLREAEDMEDGLHLGPVGGRIVGEVIIGLLQADPHSYLNARPDFKPMVPTASGNPEDFHIGDFLNFAGVGPHPTMQ